MAKNSVSDEHVLDSDEYLSEEEVEAQTASAAAAAVEQTLAVPSGYKTHKVSKTARRALKGGKRFVLIRVPKGFDITKVKKLDAGALEVGDKLYNVSKSESQPLTIISGHSRGKVTQRVSVTPRVVIPDINYASVVVPRKDVEVVKFK